MRLPYRVTDLEEVPESARELYEQNGDGYLLPVDGVESEEDVRGLKTAFDKLKQEVKQLRQQAGRVTDDDVKELEQLRADARKREEDKAKEEGRWEDVRAKLQKEHQEALDAATQKLQERDQVIERLTVTNEIQASIAKVVKPEYQEAVEALLMKRGPKVEWDGETPKGVFPDDVHGPQPISAYVEKWAKSDAAKDFLPVPTSPGGGAGGGEGGGSGKSFGGKKYSEMTLEEKAAYTGEKYADGVPA